MEPTSSTPPPAGQNLIIVAYVTGWKLIALAPRFLLLCARLNILNIPEGYSHGNDPEPLAVEVERRYRATANRGGYVSSEI